MTHESSMDHNHQHIVFVLFKSYYLRPIRKKIILSSGVNCSLHGVGCSHAGKCPNSVLMSTKKRTQQIRHTVFPYTDLLSRVKMVFVVL